MVRNKNVLYIHVQQMYWESCLPLFKDFLILTVAVDEGRPKFRAMACLDV